MTLCKKRFSQFRIIKDGRFLVGLREVINFERILASKSSLKRNILFLNKDIEKNLIECKSICYVN